MVASASETIRLLTVAVEPALAEHQDFTGVSIVERFTLATSASNLLRSVGKLRRVFKPLALLRECLYPCV